MNHLAIYNKKAYDKDYIALMLSGTRTIGFKFLTRKTAPYRKLNVGDIIYLKESSGPIRGRVRVEKVENIELEEPDEIMLFLSEHIDDIGIESEGELMNIWRHNANSHYLCWWKMAAPQIAEHPINIHKNDRRVWIAAYDIPEDVGTAFL